MKRSVVVKRIANVLSTARLETDEALANRILETVESCGLLPPTNEFDPEFPSTPNYRWSKEDKEEK